MYNLCCCFNLISVIFVYTLCTMHRKMNKHGSRVQEAINKSRGGEKHKSGEAIH